MTLVSQRVRQLEVLAIGLPSLEEKMLVNLSFVFFDLSSSSCSYSLQEHMKVSVIFQDGMGMGTILWTLEENFVLGHCLLKCHQTL